MTVMPSPYYSQQFSGTLLDSLFPSFVKMLPVNSNTTYRTNVDSAILSGPGAPSAAWKVMFDRWDPVVHLNGGTIAMRQANVKYLPKEEGEGPDVYYNRLCRSVLYGAYSRTIKTLAALPFMTPMTITGLPEELEYILKDSDGEGQALSAFAKSILEDMFNFGLAHILVEYPANPGEDLSLADEEALNMKPYFSRVDPMRLIGWQHETVGAKKILTEIRIFDDVIKPSKDNEWEEEHVPQVRVIRPGQTLIYELDDTDTIDKKPKYRLAYDPIETSLSRMNLVTIYGKRSGFMQGSPVLEELVWLNMRHWSKLSDLDNIEHIVNVPMAYAFGLDEAEMELVTFSPHSMLKSGNADLQVGYLEHSGKAIPASQNSIAMLEGRMVAMGAEALTPRGTSTRETGIAKTIDNMKATSILQELVESLEDGLGQAFMMAAEWLDIQAPENLQVNIGDKISLTVDANLITNLIDLARQENMSFDDLAREMQKRGLLLDSTELTKGKELEAPSAILPNNDENGDP